MLSVNCWLCSLCRRRVSPVSLSIRPQRFPPLPFLPPPNPESVTSGSDVTLFIFSFDSNAQNKVQNCRPLQHFLHLLRFCLLAIAVNLAQINS